MIYQLELGNVPPSRALYTRLIAILHDLPPRPVREDARPPTDA
jgi:hypothetical protein